ncbi:MAG: hypothetical protein WC444_06430 [Candidatus Paceibacterota bacterium]
MGWLDTFSAIVGGVGSAASLYSSIKGQSDYNNQVEASEAQGSRISANQDLIRQMALKNLSSVESMNDPESWGRTAGLFRAILQGAEPEALDVFKSQFDEIEYATQAKLRDIDAQAETARRMIADKVPTGGLKMRMLADVAMKAQDEKAAATAKSREDRKTLNLTLKNEYMGKALEFGKTQPTNLNTGYQSASGILQGYPTTAAASPNQVMQTSYYQNKDTGETLSGIGESLAKLSSKTPASTTGQVTTTPAKTSAETFTEDWPSEARFIYR